MTDTPRALAPETVDELLSAELDDDFDAAARDLGFEPDAARTALASVPGVDSRREALGRARDALAVLPQLDELTAQRLRSTALRASTQAARAGGHTRRWQRVLAVSGAVAAAAAVVVGIVAVSSHRNNPSKTAATSNAAAPKAAPGIASAPRASGPVQAYTTSYNLGAVPDLDSLAARVKATEHNARRKDAAKSPAALGAESTAGPNAQSFAGVSSGSASGTAGGGTVQLSLNCDVRARAFAGVAAAPTLRATATLAGAPVIVEAFAKDARTQVLVVMSVDCRLVNLRTLAAD
jgi:hypothetical protein